MFSKKGASDFLISVDVDDYHRSFSYIQYINRRSSVDHRLGVPITGTTMWYNYYIGSFQKKKNYQETNRLQILQSYEEAVAFGRKFDAIMVVNVCTQKQSTSKHCAYAKHFLHSMHANVIMHGSHAFHHKTKKKSSMRRFPVNDRFRN